MEEALDAIIAALRHFGIDPSTKAVVETIIMVIGMCYTIIKTVARFKKVDKGVGVSFLLNAHELSCEVSKSRVLNVVNNLGSAIWNYDKIRQAAKDFR